MATSLATDGWLWDPFVAEVIALLARLSGLGVVW